MNQNNNRKIEITFGDLVVSLKCDKGKVLIATQFECMHIPGNFRKLTNEDRIILNEESETKKLKELYEKYMLNKKGW